MNYRTEELSEFSKNLADVVKQIRLRKDLSKNKLSELSGLSRQTITFIENYDREPAGVTLFRLAKGLGTPLWEIIREAEC